jgi:hypothetical protein
MFGRDPQLRTGKIMAPAVGQADDAGRIDVGDLDRRLHGADP